MNDTENKKLIGRLHAVKLFNDWGKATFIEKSTGNVMTVTGKAVAEMDNKKIYEITVSEKRHPKWGVSFEINHFLEYIECSRTALSKFLCKHFKGIGKVTADKVVKSYEEQGDLEGLRQALLTNPYSIDFSSFTKRPVQAEIRSGLVNFIQNSLFLRFGGLKELDARNYKLLSNWLADVLSEKYEGDMAKCAEPVTEALEIFTGNPYAPVKFVSYYGFKIADSVGMMLNIPRSDPRRLEALTAYVLEQNCNNNGHAFLYENEFNACLKRYDATVDPAVAIRCALAGGQSIVRVDSRYYTGNNYRNERELAVMLAERLDVEATPVWNGSRDGLDEVVAQACREAGILLDDSQYEGLVNLFTQPTTLHSVTSGPGCGKTRLVEILSKIMGKSKIIQFCAPTGKAAKVLNSRISKLNFTATTIHSLLGVRSEGQFNHNASNPLPCDILIVDESGMNDLAISHALISACKPHTHIIFLGDTKQLPSIGPGNVLGDFMRLHADHNRLTKTHRNSGGILKIVNEIGEGYCHIRNYEDVTFRPLPDASAETVEEVLKIYEEAVRRCDQDLSRIGLLVARRVGKPEEPGWNVTYLNHQLQKRFNFNGRKIAGTRFHINDRIIIKKNATLNQPDPANPFGEQEQDKEMRVAVVNGDTGFIIDEIINPEDGKLAFLLLKMDDDRVIYYPSDSVPEMDLAYALSVHASQGSEYDHVLFLNVNGSPNFIHRGIPFTACSRAKVHLHVFTEPDVLTQIARRPIPPRNTYLVEETERLLNEA